MQYKISKLMKQRKYDSRLFRPSARAHRESQTFPHREKRPRSRSGKFRITAILNALDDADLCKIGKLTRHGIEVVSQDCCATPMACNRLLDDAADLARDLFCFLRDERIIDWLEIARAGWPSPTIVIPNSDRSAAIGMTHVVEMHAAQSARNPTPLSERPDIDRGACYLINGMPVTIRATGKKDYQFPDQFWRVSLRERFGHVKHPAVRLRVKLLDGFAPGTHREPPSFEPASFNEDEKERFHLLYWARQNGWRPFTSLEDLDGFFD